MTACTRSILLIAGLLAGCSRTSETQEPPTVRPPATPAATTKLESFKPAAGTLITFGYDELGAVSGISFDAREMKDDRGSRVRGLVVEVTESQYREERAFVDADEIAELIRGLDALLAVTVNPTPFKNFEVRYTTRGELQLTAFNDGRGALSYSVRAGRTVPAQRFITAEQFKALRVMLVAAQAKVDSL